MIKKIRNLCTRVKQFFALAQDGLYLLTEKRGFCFKKNGWGVQNREKFAQQRKIPKKSRSPKASAQKEI
jgi:hypothetical protein